MKNAFLRDEHDANVSTGLLPWDYEQLFRRDFRDEFLLKIEMRPRHFRRQPPYPIVQGDVYKLVGLKHFQKNGICFSGVFDVMTSDPGNKAHVVCIEVHGAGFSFGHEYSHASFALDPELPLASVGMPVQLAQSPRFEIDDSDGNILGNREIARVHDADLATGCFPRWGHILHFEDVLKGRFHVPSPNCRFILHKGSRKVRRKNVKRFLSQLSNIAFVESKILR